MAPITKNAWSTWQSAAGLSQPGASASPVSSAGSSRGVCISTAIASAHPQLSLRAGDFLLPHRTLFQQRKSARALGIIKVQTVGSREEMGVGLCSAGIFSGQLGYVDVGSPWRDWIQNQATDTNHSAGFNSCHRKGSIEQEEWCPRHPSLRERGGHSYWEPLCGRRASTHCFFNLHCLY